MFDDIGVPYSQSFVDHLDRVVSRRKRWKEYHSKIEVKRRRAHKQDATEYASGIGLDIGSTAATRKKPEKNKKRTNCRCGSTTHQTTRFGKCILNKKNLLLAAAKAAEGKESEREGSNNEIIAAATI